MNVAVLDDDVAEVDADPEYDPLVFRGRDVAFGHSPLHGDRAGDRLDDTRKLNEDSVASRLNDPALVFADFWLDQFATMGSKPRESPGFVLTHEPAISGDIGGENGRKPALYP